MAKVIIAAVRARRDLKESLLHTAQELAHLASDSGVAQASYAYLAQKCHCSIRTVIRHIHKLQSMGILRKTVIWIKGNFCEINTYTFTIPWKKEPERLGSSDNVSKNLPPQEEREKNLSIRDEIRRQEIFLRTIGTPGSDAYTQAQVRLTYLRSLLGEPPFDASAS